MFSSCWRTLLKGKYWLLLSPSILPIGIVSINVRSISFSPHQFTSVSNSLSLIPFNATVLILTFSPADLAASMPDSTLSNFPQRVISLNFVSTRVSKETLILLTPLEYSLSANFSNWLPLVVRVSSSSAPDRRWRPRFSIRFIMSRRTRGSPPLTLSFLTPRPINTVHNLSSSSRLSNSAFGKNDICSDMQ